MPAPASPASRDGIWLSACLVLTLAATGAAQDTAAPFEPVVGQPGKDVVWVPSPPEVVEMMLDLAGVSVDDFVIDLGSGDGRNVIAAARRGARGLGVEYNPDMVALSRRLAAEAGVAPRAVFEQGDMFEADISQATVLALFLLPSNLLRLQNQLLSLEPGSRIVANTYGVPGWEPDETRTLPDCELWCNALLWIVPADARGNWDLGPGDLRIDQEFQMLIGSLDGHPLTGGRLRGPGIAFTVGDAVYRGRVDGDVMEGSMSRGGVESRWRATRR